jgi:hypothetical protein
MWLKVAWSLHEAQSKENKNFHIVFSYWLYQRILKFAYRQFLNTLTDGLQNVVRNQVSKFARWSDGVGVGDDNNSNNITYYYN